jgi:glycosyltransferase involved in cell wall biosynthesis
LSPALRVLVVTNLLGPFARMVEGLRRIGVDVDQLYLDRRSLGRRVYLKAPRLLRRAVKGARPDVIHVIYGGVMAEIVTRTIRKPPIVITFSGSDLLGGLEKRGPLKRVAVRYGVHASRRAAARASAVVVQAQVLADALPERDRARAYVIPDGIDTTLFAPKDQAACQRELGWNRDPSVKHVLFPASSERPEKRFELAAAGAALVDPPGSAELHELSSVPHDQVPNWLNAADAIVLTSTHEGSPNVVKEALACNVAVVSVDVGDVREQIEGIEGCFLAEPTPADIADKLARALARGGRVDGRERMAGRSLEGVARQLLDVYRSVAGPA